MGRIDVNGEEVDGARILSMVSILSEGPADLGGPGAGAPDVGEDGRKGRAASDLVGPSGGRPTVVDSGGYPGDCLPMSATPDRSPRGRASLVWPLSIFLVPVVYVLSFGPMARLHNLGYVRMGRGWDTFYRPVYWLQRGPLGGPLAAWHDLWIAGTFQMPGEAPEWPGEGL